MSPIKDDELLTLAEVAAQLKIRDRRTVVRQLERSGVALIKVGRSARVRASQLERMLNELEWQPELNHAAPDRAGRVLSENGAPSKIALVGSRRDREGRRDGSRMSDDRARRGWTEALGDGLYRRHRLSCRASKTKKPGVRCDCPFACHQPTAKPGKTSLKTIPNALSAVEGRRLKKQLQGAGRPSAREGDGTVKLDVFFREVFLKLARLDESTKDSYLNIYERTIKPHFGHRRLVDITEEAVERWVRDLEADARKRRAETGRRATRWVQTQAAVFSSALSHAVRWRRIKSNPFAFVGLEEIAPLETDESETSNPEKVLDREQLQLLFTTLRRFASPAKLNRQEALIRCGLEQGMRNGEVRGLRYSDFDFAAGKVRLRRQIDRRDRVKWLKGKEERTLPVSARLLELVSSLLEQDIARGASADSYVFPGHGGGPIAYNTANAYVGRMQVKAGLVDATGRHLIPFHGLRHTCASLLLAEGVAPIRVSRFLGHASLRVTLDTYAHLLNESELDGMTAVFDNLTASAVETDEPEQLAA